MLLSALAIVLAQQNTVNSNAIIDEEVRKM